MNLTLFIFASATVYVDVNKVIRASFSNEQLRSNTPLLYVVYILLVWVLTAQDIGIKCKSSKREITSHLTELVYNSEV